MFPFRSSRRWYRSCEGVLTRHLLVVSIVAGASERYLNSLFGFCTLVAAARRGGAPRREGAAVQHEAQREAAEAAVTLAQTVLCAL